MPEVSVVIPTHNRSDFLRGAIASVLNQTFQDFEIIIVDDASQDDTARAVRSFDDRRIKYIRHETNRGGAAARNTAIRNSTGRYVAFLDDDDEWHRDKLRLQLARMESSSGLVGGVYTGYLIVDRSSGEIRDQKVPVKEGDLSKELLKNNCLGGSSTVLLKKECFAIAGLFDERLPCFQDRDLWIRIGKSFHYAYVKEPLVKYYVHANKIWTNLDAIQAGIELMLQKHGSSRDIRKNMSYYYLRLGVRHSENGNMLRSRHALRKAIGLYPFEMRHYFNLCLSLMGKECFVRVKNTKRKLLAAVK